MSTEIPSPSADLPPGRPGDATADGPWDGLVVEGTTVHLPAMAIDDATLATLLSRSPAESRSDVVARALAVGARGLTTMGLGVDLDEIDRRVTTSVTAASEAARAELERLVSTAHATFESTLDPERRSSMVGQTMDELGAWRDRIASQIDPGHTTSHTGAFLQRISTLLGPGGDIESGFRAALDPAADGSALHRLAADLDHRLVEIRDLIVGEQARQAEAEVGTQKGFAFEDVIDEALRVAVRHSGCTVERTAQTTGALSVESMVGDFVVQTPEGARIVVEAKNTRRITLNGSAGILDELDRAMTNRDAQFAVCVAATDAYPAEVDGFGVYGDRLLIVDDGTGTMVRVAMEWARARLATRTDHGAHIDIGAVLARLDALARMATRFSGARRSLTDVKQSVENVRATLDGMRADLIDLTNDLVHEVRRAEIHDSSSAATVRTLPEPTEHEDDLTEAPEPKGSLPDTRTA